MCSHCLLVKIQVRLADLAGLDRILWDNPQRSRQNTYTSSVTAPSPIAVSEIGGPKYGASALKSPS